MIEPEITELSAKLDGALHEFDKLDLGYTYADEDNDFPVCGSNDNYRTKKRYPTAYISRVSDDPKDFPETGKAIIEYKVTEKRTRSSSKSGKTKARHSMDIEIHSIEPVKKNDKTKTSDPVSKLKGSAEPVSELSDIRPGMIEFISLPDKVAKAAVKKVRKVPLKKIAAISGATAAGTIAGGAIIRRRKKKKDQAVELESLRPGMIEFSDPRPRNPQGQFADVSTGGANPQAMKAAYGQKPGVAMVGGQAGMGQPLIPRKKVVRSGIQPVTKAHQSVV
jgi:hypothetical protein